jgi:hypothetical protein
MAKRYVTMRLDEGLLADVDALPGSRTAAVERGLRLVLAEVAADGGSAGDVAPAARLESSPAIEAARRAAAGRALAGRLVNPKAGVMPIPKGGL